MQTIKNKLKQHKGQVTTDLFRNEAGAIDLASIMVGVIVIGLIGGVVAATVFSVIPWAQDNAAKQQLDSVASAESAYMGLSSAVPSPLPAGYAANSFGNSTQLAAANLLTTGNTYCAVTPADGKNYTAYSKSASGKVWSITDKNTKPANLTDPVPAECGFTADGTTSTPPAAYVDPTPTLTTLTYRCGTPTTGTLPWEVNVNGTETWSEDFPAVTYTNAAKTASRNLIAGKTYKVTFDGTYQNFTSQNSNLKSCLISMDHWGRNTGVTNASYAFFNASQLTTVPAQIPLTINNMRYMLYGTTIFNQSLSTWDVSNVTDMYGMLGNASIFDQPLNNWDTSKVTEMGYMFYGAARFNQPLNDWKTGNVMGMHSMFYNATKFNQNIKNWNVSKVTVSTNFRVGSALTPANSPF